MEGIELYLKCFRDVECIKIPQELQQMVIDSASNLNLKNDDLRELGEDVYLTQGIIPPHIDDTFDGLVTLVCVLYSTGDYWFGCRDERIPRELNKRIYLPTGHIFKFDARYKHELNVKQPENSLFGAIIWDIPSNKTVDQGKIELQERINYLVANGLPTPRKRLTNDLI